MVGNEVPNNDIFETAQTTRMYRYLLLLCFLTISLTSLSQTTIWTDNFNNGCAANCIATTWNGWSILDNVGGTTGGAPNNWFVSCAEEGVAPPGCGSSCVGDASLHIGANPGAGGDMGASYNETGATNATYRMAVSPVISSVGYTNITLSFDFIAFGSAACSDDRLQLRLSANNGATWPAGYQYCLTSVCCGACNGYSQGQWTTYTLVLPAAFDNNPNIRVGFHWRNNGNGSGTDPSAAIDDIFLTTPTPLSADLVSFTAQKETDARINVNWTATHEVNFSHYDLERSTDGKQFTKIHSKKGICSNTSTKCQYTYSDERQQQRVYYRLKMVDNDGHSNYSSIISIDAGSASSSDYSIVSALVIDDNLQLTLDCKRKATGSISVYSTSGKLVASEKEVSFKSGINQLDVPVKKIPAGVYLIKIQMAEDGQIVTGRTIKK